MAEREILFDDLARAATSRSPELPALIAQFLAQPDPAAGQPEITDPDQPSTAIGALDVAAVVRQTSPNALRGKTATERKNARKESWDAALSTANPTPRLRLAGLLLEMYKAADAPARALLLEILAAIPLVYGPWQAVKAIYKESEARHDAAMFAMLATRFDPRPTSADISAGTFVYLARRAWRYMRLLGRALPAVYVDLAVEVLGRYPASANMGAAWIANQIWGHKKLIGTGRVRRVDWQKKIEDRYLDAAWKVAAQPLLTLLESCQHDEVAELALGWLEKDFPDTLRSPSVPWLIRLAQRKVPAVEAFVVKTLSATPELHASRFAQLGLHDTVLGFVFSRSPIARAFALEYARSHAPDLSVDELVAWARVSDREVVKFALSRLEAIDAKKIGLTALAHLAGSSEAFELAKKKILSGFTPEQIDRDTFIVLATGTRQQRQLASELWKGAPPAPFLIALLEHEGTDHQARQFALNALGKLSGAQIGFDWVKRALLDHRFADTVSGWLRAGRFQHPVLDVEWMKELVLRPKLRPLVIEVFSHTDWVPPAAIGAAWLVALLDHADEALAQFAEDRLISSFTPDALGGIDRVIALFDKPGSRSFAARYLAAHHPDIAGESARGVTPALPRDAFTLARIRPLFFHTQENVRAVAAQIGAREMVRWGDAKLPYVLAESPFKEARLLAKDVLLAAGDEGAAPAEWLDRDLVFGLAESRHKATRELGVQLIRQHYVRLDARDRLAWLMESPDREVRLFAVRILWEKHRLDAPSPGFRPKTGPGVAVREPHQGVLEKREQELSAFLRMSLFGLPPGRLERRDGAAPKPIPASVAKQRLIEVVRDMAIEDRAFGALAAPILRDFTGSTAKGEWQACVAALARIAQAHPDLRGT